MSVETRCILAKTRVSFILLFIIYIYDYNNTITNYIYDFVFSIRSLTHGSFQEQ